MSVYFRKIERYQIILIHGSIYNENVNAAEVHDTILNIRRLMNLELKASF